MTTGFREQRATEKKRRTSLERDIFDEVSSFGKMPLFNPRSDAA